MRFITIAAFLAVTAASSGVAAQDISGATQTQKPTVAVRDFEYGSVRSWWEGTWDIGKGISDMLTDRLLESGNVRLVERKQLDAVIDEQDLAASGRVNPQTSSNAATGRIVSARYLITGSVTQFGGEAKDFNVGGIAGSLGSVFGRRAFLALGAISTKKTTAHVELTTRVIDSTTGEILLAVKSAGESRRKDLLLGGLGATNNSVHGGAVGIGSSEFRQTILGEATEAAVADAATKLLAALSGL